MKQFTILLTAIAALAACAPGSSANTVSYVTSTPVALTETYWNNSLTFQKFNPSLGTLNSVTLNLSSSVTATFLLFNPTGSTVTGTAVKETVFILSDPASLIDQFIPPVVAAVGYGLSAGGVPESYTNSNTKTYEPLKYTAADILAEFTGDGTIAITAKAHTGPKFINTVGPDPQASVDNMASLTGTVVYNYTPAAVPDEAPTFILLVLGLGACRLSGQRHWATQRRLIQSR